MQREHAVQPEGARSRPRFIAWERFRRHRLALFGLIVLALIGIASYGADILSPFDPNAIDILARNRAPSLEHLLGTDGTGRDVATRLLYAGRVSLTVAIVAVALAAAIGILVGSLSGYFGGAIDTLLMRLTDAIMSVPTVIVAIALVAVLGPNLRNVIILFGVLGWPAMARIVRAQFPSYRQSMFVEASHALGANHLRIIFRHILPNSVGAIVVTATFDAGKAILLEAGLSFLGLGVQPPAASWGNMINAARTVAIIENFPWLWLPPGLMIATTVLVLNFIGDGLRDALDPRSRA
jgi:peptide/nickel transport system permease protein